jgi:serine protease Do
MLDTAIPSSAPCRRRGMTAAALAVATLVFTVPPAFARPGPEGFSDLAEKVKPAVVNISTTQRVAQAEGGSPMQFEVPPGLRGSPFEEFFRRFGRPGGPEGDEDAPGGVRSALGSGFIIDASGYVVTNNHVIQDAEKVAVTLSDGRKLDAKVVGRDDKTDVALIKVESDKPLPFVPWGDSDKAKVGDWILAVGNPFGLGGTVTAGIVSARGRDIQSGPFDDYLQIDAPINRGNSGGPTFNMNGEVIGINTAIYSPTGGSIGIGFAIPASLAKPIVEDLRTKGRVDRGWLGVSIQPMSKEIAGSLGLDGDEGALVLGVTPDSPAAKAGLKQGDVIRSVDGKKVAEFRDLARLVAGAGPEKNVKLGVWRDGRETQVSVALGQTPSEKVASAEPGRGKAAPEKASALGLALAPVTRETRQRYNLPDDAKGAVVVDVKRGAPAAEVGIRAGDIITRVGDKAVSAPEDVIAAVKGAKDRKAVLLLVTRQGNERFVAVPLGNGVG